MKLIEVSNFTRAAESLNITTSALRHSIIELEKYCGEKLILRERKRVRPTHLGNIIHEKLLPLYEQSKQILQYLPININNKERCFKIMLSGFHNPDIPQIFIKHADSYNFQYLISDSNRSCYEELKEDNCDIAIYSYLEDDIPEHETIDRVHLSNEHIGLLARRDLHSKYTDMKLLLKNIPLTLRGSIFNQPYYYSFKEKINQHNIVCKLYGMPDFIDILNSVENGTSVTLIPEMTMNYFNMKEKDLCFIKQPFPFEFKVNRSIYFKSSRVDEIRPVLDFLLLNM